MGAVLLLLLAAGVWLLARGSVREAAPTAASRNAGESPGAPEIPETLRSLAPQVLEAPSARSASAGGEAGTQRSGESTRPLPELTVRVVDPEGKPVDLGELPRLLGGEERARIMLSAGIVQVRRLLGEMPDLLGWRLEASQVILDAREFGPASVGPPPTGTTTAQIRLPRAESIEGIAVGPHGEAVGGAFFEARPAPAREGEPVEGRSQALRSYRPDPQGALRPPHLAPYRGSALRTGSVLALF